MSETIYEQILEQIQKSKNSESYNVWVDEFMILTDSEIAFRNMVNTFDILGLEFTTGEPDGLGEHYYIDFE